MSGGKDNSGKKMLQYEKEQVAKAEALERERQARLAAGKVAIDDTFKAIGEPFYKNYYDNYVGYYTPQIERQFGDAKDQLTFGLARAGTLKSSVAADKNSKLFGDRLDKFAEMRSQADAAAAGLRGNVSDAKNAAISQLYATEDPTLATNTAVNSVKGIQNAGPKYDPLGELFNVAALGAAGYLNANTQRAAAGGGGGGIGSGGSASRTRTVI